MAQLLMLLLSFSLPDMARSNVDSDCQASSASPCFVASFPVHVTVPEGSDAHIDCIINNLKSSKTAISWWREGEIAEISLGNLVTNDRYRIAHKPPNIWTLIIPNVTPHDQGKYICQINTRKLKEKFFSLTVEKSKSKYHLQNDHNNNAKTNLENKSVTKLVITGPSHVSEGEELLIRCSLHSATPIPVSTSVVWLLNGRRRRTSVSWPTMLVSMQVLRNHSLVSTVLVEFMQAQFAGEWTCMEVLEESPNSASPTNRDEVRQNARASMRVTMVPNKSAKLISYNISNHNPLFKRKSSPSIFCRLRPHLNYCYCNLFYILTTVISLTTVL